MSTLVPNEELNLLTGLETVTIPNPVAKPHFHWRRRWCSTTLLAGKELLAEGKQVSAISDSTHPMKSLRSPVQKLGVSTLITTADDRMESKGL